MDIEAAQLTDVVNRLKRVQGQVGGIIRMIEEEQDCSKVITQLAAASKALDKAGFKIIATGLRQCLSSSRDEERQRGQAELERLFLSLS